VKLNCLLGACPLAAHIGLYGLSHLMRFARRLEADPGVRAAILAEEGVLA
jgi:hypothetical protein